MMIKKRIKNPQKRKIITEFYDSLVIGSQNNVKFDLVFNAPETTL